MKNSTTDDEINVIKILFEVDEVYSALINEMNENKYFRDAVKYLLKQIYKYDKSNGYLIKNLIISFITKEHYTDSEREEITGIKQDFE